MPTVSALWRWRQEYEEFRVILSHNEVSANLCYMSVGNGFVGSSEGNKVGREERVGLR